MNWHAEYDAAREELTAADTVYKWAESELARASARRNAAERRVAELFRARANQVNAEVKERA